MPEGARERLAVATAELMAERGYEHLAIAAIVDRAGVDRAEFERRFDDLQDCVLKAYWYFTEEFNARLYSAYEAEQGWRDGFRAAAYAAARYIRDNPEVVRFGTVEMFGAGLMAQVHRQSQLQRWWTWSTPGARNSTTPTRSGAALPRRPSARSTSSSSRRSQSGRGTGAAEDFVPDLMYIAVRPYLGHEVAREELSIPPPPEEEPRPS